MTTITLHAGDCRDSLRRLIDEGVRVHSVVTDPPYGLVSVQKRFGKPGSAPARTDRNDGSFARLSGGFMGKCYHPDTEVLTDSGWCRIGEVPADARVATLDPRSRHVVWQFVAQHHAYPFRGDLIRLAHRSAEQLVTPNHNVVTLREDAVELTRADSLPRKFHMTAQAVPIPGRTDDVTISSTREFGKARVPRTEERTFRAEPFFRFLGLWLGDGFSVSRTDDHPANDFFGFAVRKGRKVAAIRDALEAMSIRFTETASEGRTTFYCYDFALLGFLKTLGRATEKHIPTWAFQWDATCLERLYQGLIDSDGHRPTSGPAQFYTSSRRLADDFQRLCLHTGRSASLKRHEPGPTQIIGVDTFAAESFTACVLAPGKRLYAENATGRNGDIVSRQPYVGDVICLGVEKHHILYTRFGGKPVWSGNSWDATGIERDPEFWRLIHDVLLPGGFVFAFSGSRTGHWQAVAMEQAGLIMHPMHGWVYGCMDPETECLTRRGWLAYTDLLPEDEVLQWDSETDSLTWVRPEAIHEYDFDGRMAQIKNRHTHQVLTPNHRVYAKVRRHSRHPKPTAYEVVTAREIQHRPANWQVDLPMASTLYGGTAAIDPTFAYLVGWWLTDAWAHQDANACCFSQSKPATLAKLRAALHGLGASEYVRPGREDSHRDEHSFYLGGPVADRLRREFPDRVLGWHVLDWPHEARQALYEGLMDGDGSRDRPGQTSEAFWSQKQDRRDVFLALALSLGIRCYEDPKGGVVYVNPKTRTTQVQGKHRVESFPYKGKVWCLTVPTGAFVVRRSGRPFITGNSGFPKAHNAARAVGKVSPEHATDWEGWAYGTQSQKPALEPIYLGQRPMSEKTGAANLLKHGVGAFNIDGCRVPTEDDLNGGAYAETGGRGESPSLRAGSGMNVPGKTVGRPFEQPEGRHPANLLLDGSPEVTAMFPDSAGSGKARTLRRSQRAEGSAWGMDANEGGDAPLRDAGEGSAARFFHQFPPDADPVIYHPKAGKADRAGGKHPTVKPVALLRYLIRHVTPPGGIVLDPFAGSGTTAEAARQEGFDCILMEAEPEYVTFLRERFDLPGSALEDLDALLYGDPAEDLI